MSIPSSENAPEERLRERLRSTLAGLAISLATLVLCAGMVEFVGYRWETATAQGPLGWTLVASRRLDLIRHGSADRHYYLFEPGATYHWQGIPVRINSRGLRDDEVEPSPHADTLRILVVGDSIVFGWKVRQEETFGNQLEALLDQRSGTAAEVIHAGIPGWNLESARHYLEQEGLDYEPDWVLLSVTVVNDIRGEGPQVESRPAPVEWLRDNTYGWPFLTTQMRFLLARQQGPEAIPVLSPPRDAIAYYPLDEESPVWERIWQEIEFMRDASEAHGARFALIIFPSALQLNSAAHPDVPQRLLGARAAAAGIPVIDLLPTYRAACDAAGPDACEGYENHLFADVWMHPNRLGHEIAAEQILATLDLAPTR